MATDTVTLSLMGDVPLNLFAQVMVNFDGLIQALSAEIAGPEAIVWEVARLEAGSTLTTARGISAEAEAITRVIRAYEVIGQSLEDAKPIPYSEDVTSYALAITAVLNSHITSVRFITDERTASVNEPVALEKLTHSKRFSLGVITGVVGAIWDRPRLKLSVHDALFNRVIYCYLDESEKEKAREVWGRQVAVSGLIYRDPDTGRPIDVRQVTSIKLVESAPPYSFRQGKGAVPWQNGDPVAEILIRRVRDGN